jgi:hypothetical protein
MSEQIRESQIRDELLDLAIRDLLGPAGGLDEELSLDAEFGRLMKPTDRYLLGMLAPRDTALPESELNSPTPWTPEDGDGSTNALQADTPPSVPKVEAGKTTGGGFGPAEDEDDDEPDPTPNNSYFPTSFGMTFCVAGDVDRVHVQAEWGQYLREASAIEKRKSDDSPLTVWKRHPRGGNYQLILKDGPIDRRPLDVEFPNVVITGRVVRRTDEWIVTILLTNDQGPAESKVETVTRWLFQPVVTVSGVNGQSVFVKRRRAFRYENLDPHEKHEVEDLEMLYRKRVEFAVGHGVAVDWNRLPNTWARTDQIWTTCVPVVEVPKAIHATASEEPELADLVLDMKELAESSPQQLEAQLKPIVTAYKLWIERQRKRITDASEGLQEFQVAAERALKRCSEAADRIDEGIKLLGEKDAASAFQFANRAMWLQRIHTMLSEANRRGEAKSFADFDIPKNRSWRAFQLAFVLLNLPGLVHVEHQDRKEANPDEGTEPMADLLWFPTGGGKTEAYLGLTAFTLAIRRLQGDLGGLRADAGVAVLMRYTLRLLTLQQFQRATALICACESIRRDDETTWGSYPFRIGLWVGARTTPNRTENAREAVDQERDNAYAGGIGGIGTVRQLTNCPWCGHKIDVREDIEVITGVKAGRTYTYCGDKSGTCLFTRANSPRKGLDGGLPVVVVDEEIYRLLPSLVIATVDKFAQMPWNGETQMLFGRVNRFCPRHGFLSPESDHDATTHPSRGDEYPKVDIKAHLNLRPPDLIIQDELHLISGPLGSLVGIYEAAVDELCTWEVNGTRVRPKVIVSTATVRRASEQVNKLFDRKLTVFPPTGLDTEDNFFSKQPPATRDNPGTKYVGICSPGRRLKASLIRTYCASMAAAQKLYDPARYGAAADPWMTTVGYFGSIRELAGMRRLIDDDIHQKLFRMDRVGLGRRSIRCYEELTSRKSAGDIPNILDRLEKQFTTKNERPTPYDILLATNMISVGVDVKRLGLMIVAGQPKMTAEYIQATNRIGRSHPGLVFTVENWARPRDLSHYESFTYYHATFHKHVETPSLTPFSDGTRERALSAILVAYSRLQGGELNKNSSAAQVDDNRTITNFALEAIVKRAENVQDAQLGQIVRAEVRSRIDEWNREVRLRKDAGASLAYRQSGTEVALLKKPDQGKWQAFTCLNSLREVEQSSAFVMHEMSQRAGMEETE